MGGVTHARLRNLATGTFWEHSFRLDSKLEELLVERQTLEFLYTDADQCWFMNPVTYEQTEIPKVAVGSQAGFLDPGMKLSVEFVEGRPIGVLFPDMLELKIADTSPPMHQQDNTFKPARLENGIEVMVPQFVKAGDMIRLDLQTMKYMDRVKTDSKAKHARPPLIQHEVNFKRILDARQNRCWLGAQARVTDNWFTLGRESGLPRPRGDKSCARRAASAKAISQLLATLVI